ncbi:condensation domain-containing protein, partial [Staphylococcus capitis]
NRNPLFDVLFTLQNNDQVSLNIGDWETELIETDSEEAKFDLSLTIEEIDNAYRISFEYSTDLFKHETISHMIEHYIEILDKVTQEPE